jgi:hypothetical protein
MLATKIAPALVAVVLLSIPLRAQTRLSGSIRDSEGAAISGAHIFIHWDPSGSGVGFTSNVGIKQDLVLTTSPDGSFSMDLPPGFYDVFVSSAAFTPSCAKIRVQPDKAAIYDVKLKASPLVTKEIGDRIFAN